LGEVWFDGLGAKAKQEYVKKYPNSKLGKLGKADRARDVFESITEADADREYDKYSYHGDYLVAGITPAHNVDPKYGYGKDWFALVMVDMTNSVEKVLYVGDGKTFIKIVGKFALDGSKRANMSSILRNAAKSGYANVLIPKAYYQKLKKNSGRLLKTRIQVNGLKGVTEDKLFPHKKKDEK
jgi:hypothetical protein